MRGESTLTMQRRSSRWFSRRRIGCRAFTLIELLVTIAIIATLLALVLPGLGGTMRSARSFKCQMALRAVSFDFSIFADDQLHGDRGDDDQLRGDRFRVETFQETQYKIDEFWGWGAQQRVTLPDDAGNDPMRCPENPGAVELRRNVPCTGGGVGPPAHISFGFNVRLHVNEVIDSNGRPRIRQVRLDSLILDEPNVPLAWDIDGEVAMANGVPAVFSGPSLDSIAVFAQDRYWFPSFRHGGSLNVAFVDGRVVGTRTPLTEPGWRWDFQPIR